MLKNNNNSYHFQITKGKKVILVNQRKSPHLYLSVHLEGWMKESTGHHVLVAPSGGLSRESPGSSRRTWRWRWRWSDQMMREGTSAG